MSRKNAIGAAANLERVIRNLSAGDIEAERALLGALLLRRDDKRVFEIDQMLMGASKVFTDHRQYGAVTCKREYACVAA